MTERHRDPLGVLWSLVAMAVSVLTILVALTPTEAAGSDLSSTHTLRFYDYDAPIATYDDATNLALAAVADDGRSSAVDRPSIDIAGASFAPSGELDAPGSVADDFANHGSEFLDDGLRMVDQPLAVPFREHNLGHVFRDAPGHLLHDTPANRALIRSAIGPDHVAGTNRWGVTTFRRTLPDGRQVWAEVRAGEITNAGVNLRPR